MAIGFHLDDIERECLSDPQKTYELNKQIRDLKKQLETTRVETIKEFAENAKKNHLAIFNTIYSHTHFCGMIDNLAKEMTEGKDES